MIDFHTYGLFVLTALALVLSPGPDTILILSRTLASGVGAGLATLIGTQTGNVIHSLLAGLGVSGLLLVLPHAFAALKYCGAAYLVYLAVATWRAPARLELNPALAAAKGGAGRFFRQGLANNLMNPKMIPFFIALFPQFVRPENGAAAVRSAALGLTLAAMALVWIGMLVLVAGRLQVAIASSGRWLKLANRLAAATFVGLACRLALQEPQ